jgi:hypothetical protein
MCCSDTLLAVSAAVGLLVVGSATGRLIVLARLVSCKSEHGAESARGTATGRLMLFKV